jgi:thiol-disulfide isomerase/thioredoxin
VKTANIVLDILLSICPTFLGGRQSYTSHVNARLTLGERMTRGTHRRMWWTCKLASAVLACAGCAHLVVRGVSGQADNVLEVEVRTAADTVAQFAYVRAAFDGTPTTVTLVRKASGRYVAAIPSGATRVALTVAVPEHGKFETQAVLPAERPAVLHVRPRPVFLAGSFKDPRVVGDFNDWKARPSDKLTISSDGHLRLAIPFVGDSVRFQIRGIGLPSAAAWVPVPAYSIAPDSAQEVSFAGIIRPLRDTLRFDVDTARFQYRDLPARLETVTADSALALANTLSTEREDAFSQTAILRGYRPAQLDSSKSRAVARARSMLGTAQDPRVRTEALVTVIAAWEPGSPTPSDEARALLAENGPGSAITHDRAGANALGSAIIFADTPTGVTPADTIRMQDRTAARMRAYLLPAARDVRIDSVARKGAYYQMVFQIAGTKARTGLDALIGEAIAAFPLDADIARLPEALGSRRILRVGAAFPAFSLTPLGGGAEITNESFRGKFTLIDFWATWCAPCIEELPVLHRAYERFKDRGFTILSVSSDASVADVAMLRLGKWPMPWLNAWSGAGLDTAPLKAMGVMGLPTAILVDSTGNIVAVDEGLRGAALERTLARLLP